MNPLDKEIGRILTAHYMGETYSKSTSDIQEMMTKHTNDALEQERQFILNVLDGIDIADKEMGNKSGGTLAIRHALTSRII